MCDRNFLIEENPVRDKKEKIGLNTNYKREFSGFYFYLHKVVLHPHE